MTPEQFIKKWTAASLTERSAAQQHFLDLCHLLGEPTPAEADPTGNTFTFEKGGTTATGGYGWADVWKKGAFAWEYKGPGKDLNSAYLQLKKYADMLENPPLLITSDTKRIEIHTNFTNTVKAVHVLEIADLIDPAKREILRSAFSNPESLRPGVTRQQVTTEAAESFSELAHNLQAKGYEPQRVAHFLNRIVFCMFAEDVGLLPNRIFTKLATASVAHPDAFEANAKQLFAGMAKGGAVAFEIIEWFNGGLFDDDATLPLDHSELKLVLRCAQLDWSNIEPSIFGTLFERGLDPDKRSQQGTHYTDPDTIMKIVRPVVVEPWVREWESEKAELAKQVDRAKKTISEAAKKRYQRFLRRLLDFRVLDPACGSGNFLYLALRALKDFEKRVILEAEALGLPAQFPGVGPDAVLGIEINPYAAELARVTIWIGEIQWMIENGFGASKNPILKPLDQIQCRDAIVNADGTEPDWPKADVIVGNPPFLGAKWMRDAFGDTYTESIRTTYSGRVGAASDLVTIWFAKAQEQILKGTSTRAGLVATNMIRSPTNRQIMASIASNPGIFHAWSDEPWIVDGADVRVSIVCFGKEICRPQLDGKVVSGINPDLSSGTSDVTRARPLAENRGVAMRGIEPGGPFSVPGDLARRWLSLPSNPNGRPNSDVLFRYETVRDLSSRPRDLWLIDFGDRTEAEAALYQPIYEYIKSNVQATRSANREARTANRWWLHRRSGEAVREVLAKNTRVVATGLVTKHRYFVWLQSLRTLPDTRVVTIARSDSASLGILSSAAHTLWTLRTCQYHGVGNDPIYTPGTCFETFPFPEGLEPTRSAADCADDPHFLRIAASANRFNELRENWLNPPELVDRVREVVAGYPDLIRPKNTAAETELKKRTLTNLYNENPAWLQHASRELDEVVAAAYGWEWPLADEEVVTRLFDLNQQRAGLLKLQAPSTSKRQRKV